MAMGLVMTGTVWSQTAPAGEPVVPAPAQAATAPAAEASGGTVKGTVKAGTVPLPGVGVTATNTLTGKKYATTTDVDGSFAMAIPRNGRYVVKAELAAFAPETKEVPDQRSRTERRKAGTGDGLRTATGFASAAAGGTADSSDERWSCARSAGAKCRGRWFGCGRRECGWQRQHRSTGAFAGGTGRGRGRDRLGHSEWRDGTDEWASRLQRGRHTATGTGRNRTGAAAGRSCRRYGKRCRGDAGRDDGWTGIWRNPAVAGQVVEAEGGVLAEEVVAADFEGSIRLNRMERCFIREDMER